MPKKTKTATKTAAKTLVKVSTGKASTKAGPKTRAKPVVKPKETELYAPIKAMLEGQDYEVKGEIGKADIVAVRHNDAGDGGETSSAEELVVVELKTAFSLSLFHQAIDRQNLTDQVYIAVPRATGRLFFKSLQNNKNLCRRLGLGLITVRMKDGFVEIHLDPAPYKPKKSKIKTARLLREFSRRVGDPNEGGAARRTNLVTAYRQDALRCVHYLSEHGPTKASIIAKSTGADKARNIMADDHYGWFERAQTEAKGIYQLTPKGVAARDEFELAINEIVASQTQAETP